MTTFSEMTSKYSGKHKRKLQKIAEPLWHTFGINYFFYLSISKDRTCSFIGTNAELVDDFFDSKMHLSHPLFCPTAKIASGVYLYDSITQKPFQETMQELERRYNAKHSCMLTKNEEGASIIYGFALPSERKNNDLLLVNHAAHLHQFIHYFEEEMGPILHKMRHDPVNLQHEADACCEHIELPEIHLSQSKLVHFLSYIHAQYQFTDRELECIKLLPGGKTAREMATLLHLSVRTIEHRLEKLKEKLNCKSKSELIARLHMIFYK